jgi:hypothetical protein
VQPWATYIRDRRPPFKVHSTKAHAYAAVNLVDSWGRSVGKRGGIVYRLEQDRDTLGLSWVEHERVPRA